MNTANNKLIAEFLGYYYNEGNNNMIPSWWMITPQGHTYLSVLRFDHDWNWLIRVVDKIELLGFKVIIDLGTCHIKCRLGSSSYDSMYLCHNKLEAVYVSCVNFIKWYNERNP